MIWLYVVATYLVVGGIQGWFWWLIATQDGSTHSLSSAVIRNAIMWPLVLLVVVAAVLVTVLARIEHAVRRLFGGAA